MRRTKAEAEQTRQSIMRSAVQVFYEKGVARTSLHEIAARIGLTRGAFYWHFRDKVDLLHALAEETFLPHEELLEKLAAGKWDNPLLELKDAAVKTIAAMMNDPHRRAVFTVLIQRCEYIDEMTALMERNAKSRDRVRELLIEIMNQAEDKGQLSPSWSPVIAATTLHGMLYGFIHMEMEHNAPDRMRDFDYQRSIVALFRSFANPGVLDSVGAETSKLSA